MKYLTKAFCLVFVFVFYLNDCRHKVVIQEDIYNLPGRSPSRTARPNRLWVHSVTASREAHRPVQWLAARHAASLIQRLKTPMQSVQTAAGYIYSQHTAAKRMLAADNFTFRRVREET